MMAARFCWSQGLWSLSGDGSVGNSLAISIVVVSLCLVVSTM
jgi:hypothetical protein